MEYVIGSLLTIFAMVAFSRSIRAINNKRVPLMIRYSQSHMHSLLAPFLPYIVPPTTQIETQATKHTKKTQVRVIFTEKEAYWIANSKLHVAQLIDGMVDEDSTKVVDTMGMDKVQLDRMVFIVDRLTEGLTNDNRNSGN